MALAIDRISKALSATPINIALAALASTSAQALFAIQSDPLKRLKNMDGFIGAVRTALTMEQQHAEKLSAQQRQMEETAQTADPTKRLTH